MISSGFGGALLLGGRLTCFWKGVASSAPSSPVLVTGRRWLLQHRYRRLLLPGGGGFLSIAGAGFRLGFSLTSIYEFEHHLILYPSGLFESLDAFGGFAFFEGLVEWLRPVFDSAVNGVPLSHRGAVSGTGGRREACVFTWIERCLAC
ncbi:hypothetical protein F2Q70_00026737 [Brassica cretica]|uniref:Uncharacterized protein n=1 Tax=Brassica cretica TaxID=69181 RepID=A0A8S9L7Q7_BRACR|nr:hypothetical protein F2Q70_00026737 [Brassica cretica]